MPADAEFETGQISNVSGFVRFVPMRVVHALRKRPLEDGQHTARESTLVINDLPIGSIGRLRTELEEVETLKHKVEVLEQTLSTLQPKRSVATGKARRTRSDKQLPDQHRFMHLVNQIWAEFLRAPRDRKTGRNPFKHFLLERLCERGEGDIQMYILNRRLKDWGLSLHDLPYELGLGAWLSYGVLDAVSDGKLNDVVRFAFDQCTRV